jgi:hypothetical protein
MAGPIGKFRCDPFRYGAFRYIGVWRGLSLPRLVLGQFYALARSARCAFVLQNPAPAAPVLPNAHLGKGNPLRVPRCIPSGYMALPDHSSGLTTGQTGSVPFRAIGEPSALPDRHTSVCLPPSTRGVPDPFEPSLSRGANPHADWMCATVSPVEPTKGHFAAPLDTLATTERRLGRFTGNRASHMFEYCSSANLR